MKRIKFMSPIGLLALAACSNTPGGSGGSGIFSSKGFAIKGPLANALVFADENGNGRWDDGESFTRTGEDGAYELSNPGKFTVVVIADEGTTNALTGEPTGAFAMSGAADAGVITPFSAFQADLDADKVAKLAEVMGLPEGFDFVNENPFGSDSGLSPEQQLAFEKAASELMTTLQVAASAAQAAAGGEEEIDDLDAFDQAFQALVEKVQEELEKEDPGIDFTDETFVQSVVGGTAEKVGEKTGGEVIVGREVTEQILHLIETIGELEGLDDDDAVKEILGGVQKSVAELAEQGEDGDPVNLSPSKLELLDGEDALGPVGDDVEAGAVIAQVAVTDDDEHEVFKFEIIGGADAEKLDIDETTGEISFKDDPDATVQDSYEVTIKVTEYDAEGTLLEDNYRTKTFTIELENVDEGPATGDLGASEEAIAIGDTATLDLDLTDPDGIETTEIVWKLDGEVIAGESGPEYALVKGDAGKTLTADVTVTDGAGAQTTLSHDFGMVAGDMLLNVTAREAVDLMADFHGAESWTYSVTATTLTVTAAGIMLKLEGTIPDPDALGAALGDPTEEWYMFDNLNNALYDNPGLFVGLDLQSASIFAPDDAEIPAIGFDFATPEEGLAWFSRVVSGEAIHMPALIEMHVSPADLTTALAGFGDNTEALATGLAALVQSVGGEMEAVFNAMGAAEDGDGLYAAFAEGVLTIGESADGYRYEVHLNGAGDLTEDQIAAFAEFLATGVAPEGVDWLAFGAIEEIRFIGPEDPLFTLQLDGTGGATVLIVDDGAGEGAVKTIGIDGAFNNSVQGLADFLSALSSASMVDIAYPEEPNPADFGPGHWQEYTETYSELVFGDPEQQDAYWAAYNAWVEEGGTEPDPSTYGGAYEDVEYTYEEYVFDDPDDQQAYNDALDAYDAEVEQLEQDAWAASTIAVIEILKGNANSYDIDGFWAKLTDAEEPLLSFNWDTEVGDSDAVEIILGDVQIDILGTFPDDIGGWAELLLLEDFFDGFDADLELLEIESISVKSLGEDGSTDLFTVSFGSTLGALAFFDSLMLGDEVNLDQALIGIDSDEQALLYEADGRFMLVSDSVDLEGLADYALPDIDFDISALDELAFGYFL